MTGAKYVAQDGETIFHDNYGMAVKFDDGGEDYFQLENLKARVAGVLLLDGDGAAALLRHCGGGAAGAAEAFGAFLADAANAGLYQATHLSLQESECAEAFRAAALLPPGRRPRRAEGLFKWLGSAADAGALLNDGWYLGTLRLVRAPAAAEAQAALGRALFPFAPYRDADFEWVKEDDGALHIGAGLADRSLTATGAEALASLVRTFGRVVERLELNKKFADGPAGVGALAAALRAGAFPQLRTLGIIYGNGATKADLGELSAACPQLTVYGD